MADKRRLEPSEIADEIDGAIVEVKKARTGDALSLSQSRKSAGVPKVRMTSFAPRPSGPALLPPLPPRMVYNYRLYDPNPICMTSV